jgi:hypothetical protein
MDKELIDSPTVLDMLVSELNHTGKSNYAGAVYPVHTRLQADLYGMVEALTAHAGISRNKMMNRLVEVGVQTTLEALPDEVVLRLNDIANGIYQHLVDTGSGLLERGEE